MNNIFFLFPLGGISVHHTYRWHSGSDLEKQEKNPVQERARPGSSGTTLFPDRAEETHTLPAPCGGADTGSRFIKNSFVV